MSLTHHIACLARSLADAIDSAQSATDPLAALYSARARLADLDREVGDGLKAHGIVARWLQRGGLPTWADTVAERERLAEVAVRMVEGFQPGPDCEAVGRLCLALMARADEEDAEVEARTGQGVNDER